MTNLLSQEQQGVNAAVTSPNPKPDGELSEIILGSAGVIAGMTMIQRSSSILLVGAECLLLPEPTQISTAGGLALIAAGVSVAIAGGGVVVISVALALGRTANFAMNKDRVDINTAPVEEEVAPDSK